MSCHSCSAFSHKVCVPKGTTGNTLTTARRPTGTNTPASHWHHTLPHSVKTAPSSARQKKAVGCYTQQQASRPLTTIMRHAEPGHNIRRPATEDRACAASDARQQHSQRIAQHTADSSKADTAELTRRLDTPHGPTHWLCQRLLKKRLLSAWWSCPWLLPCPWRSLPCPGASAAWTKRSCQQLPGLRGG